LMRLTVARSTFSSPTASTGRPSHMKAQAA
jgi:hypothetical protein